MAADDQRLSSNPGSEWQPSDGASESGSDSAATVARHTERVAESTWGDRIGRVGLAARGAVFVVFSYLVARIALGALGHSSTSKPASIQGVPAILAQQRGGRVALVALALGMVTYALFSLADAILHHNDESPAAKRWGDRALSAWGCVMYAALSGYSLKTALSGSGNRTSSGQESHQKAEWSATVLRWPAGQVWLGSLGIVLLGIALFLVSRAARRSFRPRLERYRMGRRGWHAALVCGTIGYLGRAELFAIVGGCVLSAAIDNDPSHGQGVNGSLRILARSAAGPPLLWFLAAALFGYAVYMFFETRYRKI